jgi:hypothetical protein
MSSLSRNIRSKYIEKTLQELQPVPIRFDYYSAQPSALKSVLYFSELTYTAKGTVTTNTSTDTNQPAGLSQQNTFNYNTTTQPRVVSEIKNYPLIVTGAINSGGTFTGFSTIVSSGDWFRLAFYAGASDTIIIKWSNPTGADTLTFSAIPVVSGWNYIEKKFGDGTTAGSFSFSTAIVSCEVTTATSTRIVAPYELQIANNQEMFIGNQNTIIFDALVETSFDMSPETQEIMAYNYVADTSVSGFKAKATIKVNTTDPKARAAALGQALVREPFTVNTIINASAGASSAIAISSNIITNTAWIGFSARELAVEIDGVTLTQVDSVGAVTQTTYHYAPATGVFTFANADGKVPTIYRATQTLSQGYTYENLTNGVKGSALFTRKLSTGQTQTVEFLLAQLITTSRDQGDGNLSNTFEMAFYGKINGTRVQFFKESIS